jgi:catechol 2,3-dioxygenase-like lactoylglutathione lyase family enzyme
MIGYVTLGTNDLERARAFYDRLFETIGGKRLLELPHGFTLWGTAMNRPGVAVTPPHDGQPARPGNGNMVALIVDSRARVDALHAKALELGGSDEGAPGLRGSPEMGQYFAYFRDLDGNKLAVFRIGPADAA